MECKRTYIRRKRCLNEITATIRNALRYISERNNGELSDEAIEQLATQHSSSIEAACWFPKQHMTEGEYSNLLMGKAKQLCQALIQREVSSNKNSCTPQHNLSDPEVIEQSPPDQTQFLHCYPMSSTELKDFLIQGAFSFSSISPNSIPPLIDRSVQNTIVLQ
ncbi:hypothetical protein TVAG_055080 [Trichomonas vaginalis G3]|uniref:Uncharacterized protein n=1 Tax=Trichomonas vaginalis (strain ATCC PRA-98 / G3) TaxID=412133 RepID=A2ETH6_TRIV3|nr:hypothetical protein TVAG_055080 [Trichomonas vaginalis G3]|eukprot:XP_001316245.1 hypothetical protein [Trichomonas vaginalis G3]